MQQMQCGLLKTLAVNTYNKQEGYVLSHCYMYLLSTTSKWNFTKNLPQYKEQLARLWAVSLFDYRDTSSTSFAGVKAGMSSMPGGR